MNITIITSTIINLSTRPKEDEEMVIKQYVALHVTCHQLLLVYRCSERKRDLKLSFENMRRMLYKREEVNTRLRP